jgi:hypothetical protein
MLTADEVATVYQRLAPELKVAVSGLLEALAVPTPTRPVSAVVAPETLLNARQLAARLGISEATYYARKRLGAFKDLEVKRPVGRYRYSAALVDAYLAGQPVSHYGRRRP